MITLITGLPGSGKSLFTLKTVKDLADKENRPVFYQGIPELTLDWQLMEKGEDWVNCPKGAIIVIDECQTTFRPRANGATVPRHVSQLEVHRHDGHDLFLITQHPMLLDGNVRRLVGRHFHVVRFYGFQKSTIHEFQSVRENVKSLKDSIEKHFVYPKEVFGWYKSADMHTMKKRIPARLVLVVVLPMVFIAVIWFLLSTIGGFSDRHGTEPEQEESSLVSVSGQPALPPPVQLQKYDWYAQQVERVPGLPHTKPVYDEITKPVTAPINAACVDFRGQCKCYTQQGTELNTDEHLCRQIIAKGFFIDFDPGQSITERTQQTERDRIIADRQRQEELARRDLERAASEARITDSGNAVAPASVDVRQPQADEVRSPGLIARERTAASPWAFNPNQSN